MPIPKPMDYSTCLITGASSGIGAEIAREMARRGYGVTLAARRAPRLESLAAELRDEFGVAANPIVCDVTSSADREALIERVIADGKMIDVLVNNAGLGGSGHFHLVSEERALEIIDTNIRALVSLTRRVLPQMVERRAGAVLNVASTAGFQPIPTEAVYSASKAFVVNFGDALSRELSGTGVSCTTLCPGPTHTEFASVAGIENAFESLPGFVVSDPKNVAAAGVDAMFKRKRVCIPGALNKVGAFAGSKSPRPLVLKSLDTFWPGAD